MTWKDRLRHLSFRNRFLALLLVLVAAVAVNYFLMRHYVQEINQTRNNLHLTIRNQQVGQELLLFAQKVVKDQSKHKREMEEAVHRFNANMGKLTGNDLYGLNNTNQMEGNNLQKRNENLLELNALWKDYRGRAMTIIKKPVEQPLAQSKKQQSSTPSNTLNGGGESAPSPSSPDTGSGQPSQEDILFPGDDDGFDDMSGEDDSGEGGSESSTSPDGGGDNSGFEDQGMFGNSGFGSAVENENSTTQDTPQAPETPDMGSGGGSASAAGSNQSPEAVDDFTGLTAEDKEVKMVPNPEVTAAYNYLDANREKLQSTLEALADSYQDQLEKRKAALYNLLLLLMALNFGMLALIYLFFDSLLKTLKKVRSGLDQAAEGNFNTRVNYVKPNEVGLIGQQINNLVDQLRHAASFVQKISEGERQHQYPGLEDESNVSENTLPGALISMRNQLSSVEAEENRRKWQSEGLSRFVEILRSNENDLTELSQQIISGLVDYLGAKQGGLFLVEEDEENQQSYHELKAAYAYDRHKHIEKQLELQEGLIGQCYLEQEPIYMTNVPQGYTEIKSGLGDATPDALILVPLKMNEQVVGVMELATFGEFKDYEREFLQQLADNIASTVASVRTNARTKTLLEESQQMTEQMRAQEEEMRQNMEELEATQEEMSRKESDLRKMYEESKQDKEELEAQQEEMRQNMEEMRATQDQMRKREREFNDLATNVPGMLFRMHRNHQEDRMRFSYISEASKRLFGFDPKELTEGSSILKIHDEDRPQFFEQVEESAQQLTPLSWQGRIAKADGQYLNVKIQATPKQDEEKGLLWNGIVSDISEELHQQHQLQESYRKLQENESQLKEVIQKMEQYQADLQEKEQRLSNILNSSSNMVFTMDENGAINFSNHRAKQLTGYQQRELKGFTIKDLLSQESYQSLTQELEEHYGASEELQNEPLLLPIKHEKDFRSYDAQIQQKNGETLEAVITITPFLDKNSQITSFLAEIRDVTQRVKAQKEVERMQKEQEEERKKQMERQQKMLKAMESRFQKELDRMQEELENAHKETEKLRQQGAGQGSESEQLKALAENNEAQKQMYEKRIQELEDELTRLKNS